MTEKESHVCVLNAPERIYLMTGCYLHEVGEPVEFDEIDHEGLCWSTAPDDSCEPAYVRSDIFAKVCAERNALQTEVDRMKPVVEAAERLWNSGSPTDAGALMNAVGVFKADTRDSVEPKRG